MATDRVEENYDEIDMVDEYLELVRVHLLHLDILVRCVLVLIKRGQTLHKTALEIYIYKCIMYEREIYNNKH